MELPHIGGTKASLTKNPTYGNIVSVYVGPDETISALTNGGIEELTDMIPPVPGLLSAALLFSIFQVGGIG